MVILLGCETRSRGLGKDGFNAWQCAKWERANPHLLARPQKGLWVLVFDQAVVLAMFRLYHSLLSILLLRFTSPFVSIELRRRDSTFALFSTANSKPKYIRKTRKNKYEKFSRIEEKDPLEQLLEESALKNELIAKSQEQQLQQIPSEPLVLPQVSYPNTGSIDPYDPQTFGYIRIGSIQNAHGVHGWMKVNVGDRGCASGLVYLKPARKRAPRAIRMLDCKPIDDSTYLVQLEGVCTRDEAQQLREAVLFLREEQIVEVEPAGPEEYVVADLVGLDVFMEEDSSQFVGTIVGVVFAEDISSVPGFGHDYLEVCLPRGVGGTVSFKDELVLVPLVPQIVPRIELEKEPGVFIDPPDGLLNLTYVRHEKTRIKGFLKSFD